MLEGPSYTRPEVWRGLAVPSVLRSGNHALIDRWRRAGLVNQRRFFLRSEPVVWPTREGLRLVLDGYRAKTPALSMLAHIHAVTLVRLGLERRGDVTGWVPERALYRARPSPDVHVADGEYTDRAGRRTAVEVELTVKSADRLRRIIGDLTLEYDRVLYVTGFADTLFKDLNELGEGESFIEKPFGTDGLLEATRLLMFGQISATEAPPDKRDDSREFSDDRLRSKIVRLLRRLRMA